MTMKTLTSTREPEAASYDRIVPARHPWSGLVRKGQHIRIVDLEGQQAVDTLFYSAADYSERYCLQSGSQYGPLRSSNTLHARLSRELCGRACQIRHDQA